MRRFLEAIQKEKSKKIPPQISFRLTTQYRFLYKRGTKAGHQKIQN
jgi:hypothetical protein